MCRYIPLLQSPYCAKIFKRKQILHSSLFTLHSFNCLAAELRGGLVGQTV